MAAVTVVSQKTNVNGSFREKYFKVNIATSGDTLITGFKNINAVSANDVAITKMAPGTTPNQGTITFTTTGAVTGALVAVTGI